MEKLPSHKYKFVDPENVCVGDPDDGLLCAEVSKIYHIKVQLSCTGFVSETRSSSSLPRETDYFLVVICLGKVSFPNYDF